MHVRDQTKKILTSIDWKRGLTKKEILQAFIDQGSSITIGAINRWVKNKIIYCYRRDDKNAYYKLTGMMY